MCSTAWRDPVCDVNERFHADSRIDSVVGALQSSSQDEPQKKKAPVLLRSSKISFLRALFTNNEAEGNVPLLATDAASALRLEGVQMAASNDVLRHVEIVQGGKARYSQSKTCLNAAACC